MKHPNVIAVRLDTLHPRLREHSAVCAQVDSTTMDQVIIRVASTARLANTGHQQQLEVLLKDVQSVVQEDILMHLVNQYARRVYQENS